MTAHLWQRMCTDLQADYGLGLVPFTLMRGLMKVPKAQVGDFLTKWR
jgi:hypothetical protein